MYRDPPSHASAGSSRFLALVAAYDSDWRVLPEGKLPDLPVIPRTRNPAGAFPSSVPGTYDLVNWVLVEAHAGGGAPRRKLAAAAGDTRDRKVGCARAGCGVVIDEALERHVRVPLVLGSHVSFHPECAPIKHILSAWLPLVAFGTATVEALGSKTTPGEDSLLVPVGFVSRRTYHSTRHRGRKCEYVSRVVDRGDQEPPLFTLEAVTPHENFSAAGASASDVWSELAVAVKRLDMRELQPEAWLEPLHSSVADVGAFRTEVPQRPGVALPPAPVYKVDRASVRLHGPTYFGFAHPDVQRFARAFLPSLEDEMLLVAKRRRYFRLLNATRRVQKAVRRGILYPASKEVLASLPSDKEREDLLRRTLLRKIRPLQPRLAGLLFEALTREATLDRLTELCNVYASLKTAVAEAMVTLVASTGTGGGGGRGGQASETKEELSKKVLEHLAPNYPDIAVEMTAALMTARSEEEIVKLLANQARFLRTAAFLAQEIRAKRRRK
jgi:hypothetical protein